MHEDESMDYSFDFREAARKSKSSNVDVTQSDTQLATGSVLTDSTQQKKSESIKSFGRKSSSDRNLFGATMSPAKKTTSQWKNSMKDRDSKRFKQLTMTQAFSNLNETSCSFKPSNSTSKLNSIGGNPTEGTSLHRLNIKEEPITIVFWNFFWNFFKFYIKFFEFRKMELKKKKKRTREKKEGVRQRCLKKNCQQKRSPRQHQPQRPI